MKEQRRQQEQSHDVRPVEGPVHLVEPAAEGERQHAEERHAQPEEVQRGLVAGPPGPDRRADEQGEDADRRQQVVEEPGAVRQRRQLHLRDLSRTQPKQGVDVALVGLRALLHGQDLAALFDGLAVDGQQDVPGPDTGAIGRRGNATSAATTPAARSTQSTPSSTSRDVARETRLAMPKTSRHTVTNTGSACAASRAGAQSRAGARLVREPSLGVQDGIFRRQMQQTVYH